MDDKLIWAGPTDGSVIKTRVVQHAVGEEYGPYALQRFEGPPDNEWKDCNTSPEIELQCLRVLLQSCIADHRASTQVSPETAHLDPEPPEDPEPPKES